MKTEEQPLGGRCKADRGDCFLSLALYFRAHPRQHLIPCASTKAFFGIDQIAFHHMLEIMNLVQLHRPSLACGVCSPSQITLNFQRYGFLSEYSAQLEVEEYGESSASPSREEMPPSWSFRCGGREVLKVVEASDELCDESVGSSSPDDDECGVDYGRYKQLERELRSTEEAPVSVMTESRCILPQLSASGSEYDSECGSVNQPAHDDDLFEDAKSHQQLPPWPVLPPSEDIGVTYRKKSKQWEAHLWLKRSKLQYCKKRGAQLFLGSFKSKDEAKAAHDKAAIKLDVRETREGTPYPLNFSESTHAGYIAQHCGWSIRDFVWKIRRFSHKFTTGKSGMKGVTVRKLKWTKDEYFEATISQRMDGGRKIAFDLGRFERADEAGKAYDRALLFLKGADPDCVTNFRPSRYSSAEVREVGIKLLQALYSR